MSNGYWVSKDGLRIPKSDNAQRKQWDAAYVTRLKDYFGDDKGFDYEPAVIAVKDIEPSHNVSPNQRSAFYTRLFKLGEMVPPVLVTQNAQGKYDMRDGNHRHGAAVVAGVSHIPALIQRPKQTKKPKASTPHVFTGTKVKKLGVSPMKKSEGFHDIFDLSKHERESPPELPMRILRALWAIRQPGVLTDELRQPQYRSNPDPFAGHCFVATNALFHLIDGPKTGWDMKCIHKEHMEGLADDTHWFLQHKKTGHIIDPTADQFEETPPYEKAVSKGTSQTGEDVGKPTQRAEKVIKRAKSVMNEKPKEYLGTLEHDGADWYIKPPEKLGKSAGRFALTDEEMGVRPGGERISLDDAHKLYDWFHMTTTPPDEHGQFRADPRVPRNHMPGEDRTTPRICVGPTIHHCVAGIMGAGSLWDSSQEPPDVEHLYAKLVQEDPVTMHQFRGMHVYGVPHRAKVLTPSAQQVPDAAGTGEGWLTKPTALEHVGQLQAPASFNTKTGETTPLDEPHLTKAEQSPEFQSWFAGSKAVDEQGQPLRFFHGTSKDKDFHTFKVGQRGSWFTNDPEHAGIYATDNDSQRSVFNFATREYEQKNTAPRIMPVHLAIKNPYRLSPDEEQQMQQSENYAAVQRTIFQRAKMKGHDGVDMGSGTWVAFNPNQIKSVFNTKPTQHPAIHKGEPLAKAIVPGAMTSASDNNLAQEWDYSHLLPQKTRDEGYRIRLRVNRYQGAGYDGRGHFTILANKTVDGRTRPAGTLTAQFRDKVVQPHEIRVDDDDRRKRLGMAMYEALYAHSRGQLGLTHVDGDVHSTASHLVHKKLSNKHGLDYKAKPNVGRSTAHSGRFADMDEWAEAPAHDSDGRYAEYRYKLPDVMEPKQVNSFAEHKLPGSLHAEGYRLNVAHSPDTTIGTVHRGGDVLGHIELTPKGHAFEEWTGNGERTGLRDAVLHVLRGHQGGEAQHDEWNNVSKAKPAAQPMAKAEDWSGEDNLTKAQKVYVRFGDWHSSETSQNFVEGKQEKGVSVYRALHDPKTGIYNVLMNKRRTKNKLGPDDTFWGLANRAMSGNAKVFHVTGKHVGRGFDGEPLLRELKPVKTIEPHQVISPDAGWHPDDYDEAMAERYETGPLWSSEKPMHKAEDIGPADGSHITAPHQSYTHGAAAKPFGTEYEGGNNVWGRQHTGKSNKGRTLMVQFSTHLLQGGRKPDEADTYYDKLYSKREGYHRGQDFWEVPQWQAHMAHSMPATDHYTVRDPEEAIKFMGAAGYDHVAFSALDVNKDFVRRLAQGAPDQHVVVGGYTDMNHFGDLKNVSVHPSIKSFVESEGQTYSPGYDYRHFTGMKTIPRLTLSDGCRHNCTFCCVPKQVDEKSREEILQQADSFATHLPSDLIYLNDKTFGQAKNHAMLPEIYQRIKAKNPAFKGFVIQTTAAQMKRFTPEYLKAAGIKHVELGVESVNDPILKAHKKPATEAIIEDAANKVRAAGASLIPNIMVGLPGEDRTTYARTMAWLQKHKDIISHVNAYNLALYDDSELGKKLQVINAGDRDENVQSKSWHTDPQAHADFAKALFGFANSQLDQPIGHQQELSKTSMEHRIASLRERKPVEKGEKPFIKSPAFRHASSGKVVATPILHDRDVLASKLKLPADHESLYNDWEAGYVDHANNFYDREAALAAVTRQGQQPVPKASYLEDIPGLESEQYTEGRERGVFKSEALGKGGWDREQDARERLLQQARHEPAPQYDPTHEYLSGLCAEHAIAHHEATGHPLYAIRGYYKDPVLGDETYEDAHFVTSPDGGKTAIDARGPAPMKHMLRDARFGNSVKRVRAVPVSREDIESNWPVDEGSLAQARKFVASKHLGKSEVDHHDPVSCVVMVQDGLGRTLWGKRKDGKYTMPAGHADQNESPPDCAKRELMEEAGLKAEALWLIGSGNGGEGPVHVYHAISHGQPRTDLDPDREMASWEWHDCLREPPPHITANLAHNPNVVYTLMGWSQPDGGPEGGGEPLNKSDKGEMVKAELTSALAKAQSPLEWWRKGKHGKSRISLDEAAKGYKYFRLVPPEGHEDFDPARAGEFQGDHLIAQPTAPSHPSLGTGRYKKENKTTPRVSMAPSIWHALAGLSGFVTHEDVKEPMQDEYRSRWHEYRIYGTKQQPEGFVPNEQLRSKVPDAKHTGEVWSTKPVKMKLLGVLGGDFAQPDERGASAYDAWVVPHKPLGKVEEGETMDPEWRDERAQPDYTETEKVPDRSYERRFPLPEYSNFGPKDVHHQWDNTQYTDKPSRENPGERQSIWDLDQRDIDPIRLSDFRRNEHFLGGISKAIHKMVGATNPKSGPELHRFTIDTELPKPGTHPDFEGEFITGAYHSGEDGNFVSPQDAKHLAYLFGDSENIGPRDYIPAFRMAVHEMMHGASGKHRYDTHDDRFMEEASTEILAQHYTPKILRHSHSATRDMWNEQDSPLTRIDSSTGDIYLDRPVSYHGWVEKLAKVVAHIEGLDTPAVFDSTGHYSGEDHDEKERKLNHMVSWYALKLKQMGHDSGSRGQWLKAMWLHRKFGLVPPAEMVHHPYFGARNKLHDLLFDPITPTYSIYNHDTNKYDTVVKPRGTFHHSRPMDRASLQAITDEVAAKAGPSYHENAQVASTKEWGDPEKDPYAP